MKNVFAIGAERHRTPRHAQCAILILELEGRALSRPKIFGDMTAHILPNVSGTRERCLGPAI